jgi:hypothetical protein
MATEITFDHVRQVRMGWTRRLAESLLEQFRSPQLFMDVDVIPEVWVLRSISMRQHWAGESNTSNS